MKTFRVFLSIFFLIYVFFLQNCMNIIDFNVDLRGYAYRLSLMCTSCFYHAFLLCFCNVHDGEMHTTLSLFSYGLLCAYFVCKCIYSVGYNLKWFISKISNYICLLKHFYFMMHFIFVKYINFFSLLCIGMFLTFVFNHLR